MEFKEIGNRIKERRQELKISAQEIATRLNMSKATIHRYESGDIKTIKLPVIESLARELRCNPLWLIGKTDRKETSSELHGYEKYNDIVEILDDVIEFVKYTTDLRCSEERLKREDKRAIIIGLSTVRDMTLSRYKN